MAGKVNPIPEEYRGATPYLCVKEAARTPVNILVYVEDVDSLVKRATADGAKLLRAVADQFYGERVGVLEDPFGHCWSFATHIEDVSPEEMQKRAAAQHGA